tara:strand:- start:14 stop:820 length:807 start_codon:yes stop_codon:yes gene_type:complete
MRIEELVVEGVLLVAGLVSMSFYLVVGAWSDRVGRKKPLIIGAVLTLLLLFPMFHAMGKLANPGLAEAAEAYPVVVSGPECTTDPFADLFDREQSDCGKLLETLTSSGVAYELVAADDLALSVAGDAVALDPVWFNDSAARRDGMQSTLTGYGYDFSPQTPSMTSIVGILGILLVLAMLSALTYGSTAALLTEMFPPQIRYSSMSIPYHIGAGYLGGFLPLIAGIIVARTGDLYAGLWYTWAVVAFGLVVAIFGLKGGPPRDFTDDNG